MKKIGFIFFMLLPIPLLMKGSNYSDTVIQGVNIQFSYTLSIFPDSWLIPEINAHGNPIAEGEITRTKSLMIMALAKYPDPLLSTELRAVYFLKSMSMYDVPFGGTNSNDAVYLTNDGVDQGYTDRYIEQTFHHEFSSILFRNHPSFIDTVSWKEANIPGFDYSDPEAGVGAIRKDRSSQDLDTALSSKGFLTQYAYSGIENDINTIAQNLFKPGDGFWNIVTHYPRIEKKVNLLINFYSKINPMFTKEYFLSMK